MGYIEELLTTREQVIERRRMHWVVLLNLLWSQISKLAFWGVAWFAFRSLRDGNGFLAQFVDGFGGGALRALLRLVPWWLPLLVLALLVLGSIWSVISTVAQYLNSVNLVTNRRVIQVQGVFNKRSMDSSLEKVNDVALTQSLLGRILGYGHLNVMTASEMGLNSMRHLPQPLAFKKALMDAKSTLNAAESYQIVPHTAISNQTASDKLAELQQLRAQDLISEEEFQAKRRKIIDAM